jgi:hypothetical protein
MCRPAADGCRCPPYDDRRRAVCEATQGSSTGVWLSWHVEMRKPGAIQAAAAPVIVVLSIAGCGGGDSDSTPKATEERVNPKIAQCIADWNSSPRKETTGIRDSGGLQHRVVANVQIDGNLCIVSTMRDVQRDLFQQWTASLTGDTAGNFVYVPEGVGPEVSDFPIVLREDGTIPPP